MDGRDAAGKFAPGNPGGPGRLRKAVEQEYLEASTRGCPPAEWERIVRRAVEDCSAGDARIRGAARGFLLRVLFGTQPGALVQIANVVGGDGDVLQALGRYALDHYPSRAGALLEVLLAFRREQAADRDRATATGGLSDEALQAIEDALSGGAIDPQGLR